MAEKLNEQQIRRFNRELAGHAKDQDRERYKRKRAGLAPPPSQRPKRKPRNAEAQEWDVDETGEE